MKIIAFVFLSLVCFLSCSISAGSANVGNNRKESVRVDAYENNELLETFFFQDGLNVKLITYNTQTKKKEHETALFYKNGEFDYAKIDGAIASKESNVEIKRSFDELNFQYDVLKAKGVNFPLPTIVADEVRDLSEVLSVADYHHDYKTESQVEGDQKTIKFIGFDKTSRFHYSTMALLIGAGDFITVKDYSLTTRSGFPALEVYRLNEGELTKTYSYKDGRLTGVVYGLTNLKNELKSLDERFEYHALNQNP
jgi:hypothetical protein